MPVLHRHRILILAISLGLFLFSVGLPVIVIACEMGTMVMTSGGHGLCRRAIPSGIAITRIPCRPQVRFVEGGKAAYVPSKPHSTWAALRMITVVPYVAPVAMSASSVSMAPFESPPFVRDISLLTSTLLI